MAPVFKTREYRPDGVFLATDPGSELPALLLQAQMRADPKFLLPPLPAMLSALADPDAPPLLRTLALLLETEERLPTITAQIRTRVADTALEPQIADATAAIQLARFTTRPIPEICAMGGITLKDFSQSMAYRKIFGLRELDITLRQLRRRCGALAAEQVAHIRSLARPRLEALAEALLDFQGSDDLNARRAVG